MTNHEPQNDASHVARLQPDTLISYLSAHGWEARETEERSGNPLWLRMTCGFDMVKVPLRSHYSDYGRCVLSLIKEVASVEKRSTFDLVADLEAMPPKPIAEDVRHEVVQRLIFAMWIYAGHKIDHRGPSGCIMDVIKLMEPATAQKIRDGVELSELTDRDAEDDE